ncbi:type III secretion system chaperone family protein [Devriesea agamarum]|uniref:YbjN domain-containing protein n=1 Tax=Devriesea agamarum TaxID=472569 RepID=UPI00071C8FB3|nr:YbjN domain-containing protein [Devriesea agamarum]
MSTPSDPSFFRLGAATPEALPTVTAGRVRALLAQRGVDAQVSETESAEIMHVTVAGCDVMVIVSGDDDLMQFRARWNQSVDAERIVEMLTVINEWNGSRLWPMGYILQDGDGVLGLYADMSLDVATGLTDSALERFIGRALEALTEFFEFLESRLVLPLEELDKPGAFGL